MHLTIRDARAQDHARLAELAAQGDADVDPPYLTFVAAAGRVLVACSGAEPVAFAGMVPIAGAAMVTDLFVAADARGRGVGGALLQPLLDGYEQRMTCSSKHPAALPAYGRVGMSPRWRLSYLAGRATGGGPPLVAGPWRGDRPELVDYFATRGAMVTPDAVVDLAGPTGAVVHRLCAADGIARFDEILAALPAGLPVRACVPEVHPLADGLRGRGFGIEDHDVFCATERVIFPPTVSCVHPGLL